MKMVNICFFFRSAIKSFHELNLIQNFKYNNMITLQDISVVKFLCL